MSDLSLAPAMPFGAGLASATGPLVEAVAACAVRLSDRGDAEALHDFRVALRRLRVFVRAYRAFPEGKVKRRTARALRELARSTNRARDREVTLAWLSAAGTAPSPAVTDWRSELVAALRQERAVLVQSIADGLPPLLERLRGNVAAFGTRRPVSGRFGDATARCIRSDAGHLSAELAAIGRLQDAAAIHRARIAGKRIRYLLAPWRETDACAEAEALLKRLQDLLGDLHDCHVREELIAERAAADGAATARARVLAAARGGRLPADSGQAALLTLAADNRRQMRRLFGTLKREYLVDGASVLGDTIAAACAALERH